MEECFVLLSKDALLEIFFFLKLKDLRNVCLVCKEWKNISESDPIWKRLFQRRWESMNEWDHLENFKKNENRDLLDSKPSKYSFKQYYKCILESSFLLIFSEYRTNTLREKHLEDVCNNLNKNLFKKVDIFDVSPADAARNSGICPSLELLLTYNAVLLYSHNSFFACEEELGTLLADYVDNGGGVVLTCFACCGCNLKGKWQEGKYDPIIPQQSSRIPSPELGEIADLGHPIVRGINDIRGVTSTVYSPGISSPGSKVIATWKLASGIQKPLVVEKTQVGKGKVVTLNYLPSSSDVSENGWESSSQGDLLLSNSLFYAASKKQLNE